MDEYNQGMDPQMKTYFKKILSSFSYGALWMLLMSTTGLYFGWAIVDESLKWYNITFYALFIISLTLLIRFLYRKWRS